MSKMDALRAMREAKYAASKAGASSGAAQPARRAAPVVRAAPTEAAESSEPASSASDELCGHRNMGGRTCTRERGHTAKSHRYS